MPTACYDPATGALLGTQEKSLLTIFQELNALTGAQKTAIWNDFVSGTPPKWALDGVTGSGTHGKHAPAISALSGLAIDMPLTGTWTAALQTLSRLRMVAVYLLDNPRYLENQTFGGTVTAITVPAWI